MMVPMEQVARSLADSLCSRLRARGDDLSVEAAAAIAGSIQAYALLVDKSIEQRTLIGVLWQHLPIEVRMDIVLKAKIDGLP